jgi:hypothetical protein
MPKIYRTMQGDQVDIEALFHRNELTQAVGNMRVNARGDDLGSKGEIVRTKEQKMKEYYERMNAPKRGPGRPRKAQPEAAVVPAPAPTPAVEDPISQALNNAGVTKEEAADLNDLDGDMDQL